MASASIPLTPPSVAPDAAIHGVSGMASASIPRGSPQ